MGKYVKNFEIFNFHDLASNFNEQILLLKKFYNEHKHWSKNQIKEISQKIGLKENKVFLMIEC